MKIAYLGEELCRDLFPMRGIAQSLLREYCRNYSLSYEPMNIKSDFTSRLNEINSCDVIVITLAAGEDHDSLEFISQGLTKAPIIGIATEAFDFMFQKSAYEFFNRSGVYLKDKLIELGIIDKLSLTISGTKTPLRNDIPHIYYPYFFAPSVYEDKITFMRKIITENRKIDLSHHYQDRFDEATMVYKFPNYFREMVADRLTNKIKINYGGKWRNNDSRVKWDYDFDIIKDYYSKFNYNIAVENDYIPGWITEKLMNGILAGCITIFYYPFKEEIVEEILNPFAWVRLTDVDMYRDPDDIHIDNELSFKRNIAMSGVRPFLSTAINYFNYFIQDKILTMHHAL